MWSDWPEWTSIGYLRNRYVFWKELKSYWFCLWFELYVSVKHYQSSNTSDLTDTNTHMVSSGTDGKKWTCQSLSKRKERRKERTCLSATTEDHYLTQESLWFNEKSLTHEFCFCLTEEPVLKTWGPISRNVNSHVADVSKIDPMLWKTLDTHFLSRLALHSHLLPSVLISFVLFSLSLSLPPWPEMHTFSPAESLTRLQLRTNCFMLSAPEGKWSTGGSSVLPVTERGECETSLLNT